MATGRVPTTANSPLTAKGDLFTYSTAPARLAVGNNGEQIVADSAATTGLRYSATPSASNPIINSAMQVWQRGTTFTNPSSGAYTADRWQTGVPATNSSITRQATGDTTNLPFIQYCARVQRSSGSTSTADFALTQSLESVNSYQFAGKTITFSFYARKGANYSASSSALAFRAQYSTSTIDGNAYHGPFAGATDIVNTSVTLTSTWQRFTLSGTVGATATQIGFWFNEVPVGTAGADDYYEVTGVQVDIGSVALPFRTYAATIQGELAACQRYYTRFVTPSGSSGAPIVGSGIASSTTAARLNFQLPVKMRLSAPSVLDYATARLVDTVNAGGQDVTALSVYDSTDQYIALSATVASGLTQYRTFFLYSQSAQAGYVGISAEL